MKNILIIQIPETSVNHPNIYEETLERL